MSDNWEDEKSSKTILSITSVPKSVKQITEETNLPMSTIYRKNKETVFFKSLGDKRLYQ